MKYNHSQKALFWLAICLIGITSGLGAVGLRYLIGFVHDISFLGHFSFVYHPFDYTPLLSPSWKIIVVPALGALMVVYLIKNFAPEAKGHGIPEIIYAIEHEHAKIRPHVALIKALSASICIGTGGSGGMEGPITQICASLSSIHHYYLKKLTELEAEILIGCGVGASMGAAFNAPIAGILFTIEIILPKTTPKAIFSLIISSIIAVCVSRYFMGDSPFFLISETHNMLSLSHPYFAYAMLGVMAGIVAAWYIYFLEHCEVWFSSLTMNHYLIHAGTMLAIGILLYAMGHFTGHYYLDSSSYDTITSLLHNHIHDYQFILLLLVLKIIVTCLTLGSGGSGGIFSPGLFSGAALGGTFYMLLHPYFPSMEGQYMQFAIAGMAAITAGTSSALLTSVVMTMEMTGQYSLVVPLMIVAVTAHITRQAIIYDNIYAGKKSRKEQRHKV